MAKILGVCETTIIKYLTKHGLRQKWQSTPELEITNWLKNLGVANIVNRSRTIIPPKEIDIFLPDFNLSIEYCGLYWHSENAYFKNSSHRDKYVECKNKGIALITIFEDEWIFNKEIVKNRIKNKLKMSVVGVPARKCKI